MLGLYNTIFAQPVFNLLIGIYNNVPGNDIGIAIIILTVIVKLILWPMSQKALVSQKALADLQPKVTKLKEEYKDKDKQEELAKALMALYSKEKVSPASSCLPVLVQLPVFIALYHSLAKALESKGFEELYSFVATPDVITPALFGSIDLASSSIPLAILAAITQYFQAKMMTSRQQPKGVPGGKDEQMLANMNKQMMYFMPVITLVIGASLPGGLALYWFTMNLLTVGQQYLYFRRDKNEEKGDVEVISP